MTAHWGIRVSLPALAISTFLIVAVGHAQLGRPLSEVKVTVVDEIGAVIPGCEIVFTSDSDRVVSHTGADGSVAVKVPFGSYAVTTTKAGFVKSKIVDVQFVTPMPDPVRIVLKVDHTPTGGPFVDEVPTTTSDVPSVIEGPQIHSLTVGGGPMPIALAPPAVRKSRSWQCLYLWKCSPARPSQP